MNQNKQPASFADMARQSGWMRPSPLWWVIRTYTSNRWHWLLFVVAIVMMVGEFAGSRAMNKTYMIDHSPQSPSFRSTGSPQQIEQIDLGTTWLDFQKKQSEQRKNELDEIQKIADVKERLKASTKLVEYRPGPVTDDEKKEFFKQFDQYPNLKSVKLTYLPFPDFDRLAKLEKLESLTIYAGEPALHKDFIKKLAPLKKLKRIELFMYGAPGVGNNKQMLEDAVRALADLPALETLVISYYDNFDDRSLEAIATLPHLKTLILSAPSHRVDPNKTNPVDAPIDFSILQKSRSLTKLYVNRAPSVNYQQQQEDVTPIQAVLPNIQVLPVMKPVQTGVSLWALLLAPITFLPTVVGRVLVFQYRSPMNRLVPSYNLYHASVAAFLLTAIASYFSWRMMAYDYPLLLSFFGIVIIVVSVCWTQTLAIASMQSPTKNMFKSAVFVAIIYTLYTLHNQGLLNRYYYFSLVVSIAGAGAMVIALIRSLRSLSLSPRDTMALITGLNQWGKGGVQTKVLNNRERAILARESEIESLEMETKSESMTFWKRVHRWRLGNRPSPLKLHTLLLMLPMMCLVYYFMIKSINPELVTWAAMKSQVGFFSLMVPMMIGTNMGMMWRTRLGTMPIDLLKPTTRSDLLREWLSGLVIDIAPIAVIFSIIPALAFSITDQFEIDWFSLVVSTPMIAILEFSMVLAFGMAMLTIERGWLVGVVSFGLFYGSLMTFVFSIIAINGTGAGTPTPFQFRNEVGFYIPLLITVAILSVGAWVMRFLWMRKRNFDFRS